MQNKNLNICLPEIFNTNVSQQFFLCKITTMNLQHQNTNSKGDFVLKNRFETFIFKNLLYKHKSDLDFV